jgi:hypothetical protein
MTYIIFGSVGMVLAASGFVVCHFPETNGSFVIGVIQVSRRNKGERKLR